MANAKEQAEWSRLSQLLTLLANINRDKKTRPFKPADFNPFAKKKMEKSKPDFYITPAQFAQSITQPDEPLCLQKK